MGKAEYSTQNTGLGHQNEMFRMKWRLSVRRVVWQTEILEECVSNNRADLGTRTNLQKDLCCLNSHTSLAIALLDPNGCLWPASAPAPTLLGLVNQVSSFSYPASLLSLGVARQRDCQYAADQRRKQLRDKRY
jgi:hypothetical protein